MESYTVTVGTDEEQAREAEQEARRITEQKRQSDPDAKAEIPTYMLAVDRKHTIEVEDDAFFPYGVRFNYRRVEKVDGVWRTVSHENSWVWFENPNETQTVPDADNNGTVPDSAKQIGSYEFSLHSERKDPNKLVKAGFRLGVTRDADGKRVNESAYVPLVMDRQSWDPVQHEWVRDGYWDPDRGTSGEMVREENYCLGE